MWVNFIREFSDDNASKYTISPPEKHTTTSSSCLQTSRSRKRIWTEKAGHRRTFAHRINDAVASLSSQGVTNRNSTGALKAGWEQHWVGRPSCSRRSFNLSWAKQALPICLSATVTSINNHYSSLFWMVGSSKLHIWSMLLSHHQWKYLVIQLPSYFAGSYWLNISLELEGIVWDYFCLSFCSKGRKETGRKGFVCEILWRCWLHFLDGNSERFTCLLAGWAGSLSCWSCLAGAGSLTVWPRDACDWVRHLLCAWFI